MGNCQTLRELSEQRLQKEAMEVAVQKHPWGRIIQGP